MVTVSCLAGEFFVVVCFVFLATSAVMKEVGGA